MKPILFSTPMVKAVLDGKKTQTRRVVKGSALQFLNEGFLSSYVCDPGNSIFHQYGTVGEVLWVRETCLFLQSHPQPGWIYKADGHDEILENLKREGYKWRPSIFMPKKACRLFLKVKSIRVEKLQDITQEDAKAEGVDNPCPHRPSSTECIKHKDNSLLRDCYVCSFRVLWQQINHNWGDNPWVWVIEFERIEKPEPI